MARRADVNISDVTSAQYIGAGTTYIVVTPAGVMYMVYCDSLFDVCFKKSTDRGVTWSAPTLAFTAGIGTNLSVWYDRWSNINAGLIHMVYTDSGNDDTHYRTINTESSDALSTQTVVFAGVSTAALGHLSVTRAVGGNVYCKTVIDAGVEGGFFRLLNANVPSGAWDAARTVDEVIATTDQMILLPDFDAADTQDILAIFWDASASEISRKLYDDSGNAWAEASIATSMTVLAANTGTFNFSAAPDIGNTNHILVAWSNTDTSTARLRCWTIDSGAITALTDVVSSSTDDQGLCAIGIDLATGYWYVFYGGITTGGETWNTAFHIYYKVSRDSGSTWGTETRLDLGSPGRIGTLYTCPRLPWGGPIAAWALVANTVDLKISVDRTEPRSVSLAGVM